MKIVFLDIDGVLNSIAWQENCPPKEKSSLIVDALAYWKRSIDPACVKQINRICEATGAVIVISSSWRTMLKFGELYVLLIEAGLETEVEGVTPDVGYSRWHEIFAWFQSRDCQKEAINQYVILDDDLVAGAPSQNFVRTDYRVGLTCTDADRAIAILNQTSET